MGRRRQHSMKWYPFHDEDGWIKSKCETVVVWRPSHTIIRIQDGEWVANQEDILPGYVLCGSFLGWRQIVRVLGVTPISFGSAPTPLSEKDISDIQQRENLVVWSPGSQPIKNQPVKIRDDALTSYSGLRGWFQSLVPIVGGYYAHVLLDVYGREVHARVPFDYVEIV
jgi:transcription antitermination factor NusG